MSSKKRCCLRNRSSSAHAAGVILHPTSLPGPYGIGEIGEHAYAFVDWLKSAGMRAWQARPTLPQSATGPYRKRTLLASYKDKPLLVPGCCHMLFAMAPCRL